jgi:hypothetical protein
VSVEPRDDSSFAVVVSSAATDAKELPAVLRTWRDFWELHTALRSRILSHPLPHLPAKPEGLLSETSGGRTSTPGNTRHEYANQLQVGRFSFPFFLFYPTTCSTHASGQSYRRQLGPGRHKACGRIHGG